MKNITEPLNKQYCGLIDRVSVGKRLRQAREDAGLSRDETVAIEDVDVSRTTLQQWETGAREASIEVVMALSGIYNVSAQWLLLGTSSADLPKRTSPQDDNYNHVPFYKTEASAGHGCFLDENREPTHHLAFRKRWLKAHGFSLKDLVGLIAKGDSMEPTIHDGSAIIINTVRNEALDGNIFVIRIGNRLWVKRTQWLLDGGLRLISDNETYDNIDVTAKDLEHDDIEIIGQVVHTAYDLIR